MVKQIQFNVDEIIHNFFMFYNKRIIEYVPDEIELNMSII